MLNDGNDHPKTLETTQAVVYWNGTDGIDKVGVHANHVMNGIRMMTPKN